MKKLLVFAISILLAVVLLAGCNGNNNTPPATDTSGPSSDNGSAPVTSDTPADVELTFWFYPMWEGAEAVVGAEFADLVKQEYPWITLNYEVLSYDAGPEKFTVAMATGATPDIYNDGFSRIAPAVDAGLAVDITDVAQAIAPCLTSDITHAGMVDGRNYAVNVSSYNGYVMLVNTTMARELGVYDMLPADRIHWSYDDFLDICREAKKAGKYGIPLYAGSRSSDSWYYSWLLSAGTPITKDDLSAMDVQGPEAELVLETLKTVVDEGLCPPGAATNKDEDVLGFFSSGQSLFSFQGFNMQVDFQNQMDNGEIDPFEMMMVAIPTPDGKADPKTVTWGAESLVIFKNNNDEAKIDAAKKVVELFYTNPAIAKQISENYQQTDIKGAEATFDNPALAEGNMWIVDFTNTYGTAAFGIMEPWWSDFRETFYVELQGVFTGALTPEQALENWTASGNAVIAAAQ